MNDETNKTSLESLEVPGSKAMNPFAGTANTPMASSGTQMQSQRVMQEVSAAIQYAALKPRNERSAMDRILKALTRETLADRALYSYPKGGTQIEGASIAMARIIAQNWGHMAFGVREVARYEQSSEMEAFAVDYQNNTWSSRVFHVKHWRDTRGGGYALKDEREIYELTANMGARRERACILELIPADVVEAAIQQANVTLSAGGQEAPEQQVEKLAEAFQALGVSAAMIEKRLQKRLDAIKVAEIPQLKKIYRSLADGMTGVEDWFDTEDKRDDVPNDDPPEQTGTSATAGSAPPAAEPAGEEPGPGPDAGGEPPLLDSAGQEWDAEIHAANHGRNADGTWRKRRGRRKPAEAAPPPADEAPGDDDEAPGDDDEAPGDDDDVFQGEGRSAPDATPDAAPDDGEPEETPPPVVAPDPQPTVTVQEWSDLLAKSETMDDFETMEEMIDNVEESFKPMCRQILQQARSAKLNPANNPPLD